MTVRIFRLTPRAPSSSPFPLSQDICLNELDQPPPPVAVSPSGSAAGDLEKAISRDVGSNGERAGSTTPTTLCEREGSGGVVVPVVEKEEGGKKRSTTTAIDVDA